MAIILRLLAFLRVQFTKWIQAIVAVVVLQAKEWIKSMSDYADEQLRERFLKGNPDAQDLLDFIRLMNGKGSAYQQKIDARLSQAAGKIAEEKAELIAKFDRQSDAFHLKHPVIFNDSYRSQLRTRLVDFLDKSEEKANRRMIDGAAAGAARGQLIIQNAIAKATNAVDRANATRAEIAALRSPKFVGRSDTQIKGYRHSLTNGTASGQFTIEELDNEILGRKKAGKFNPH